MRLMWLAERPHDLKLTVPFGEAAESDPASNELVDDGEDVLGVASEAVQLPDGQHVAFAEVVEAGVVWSSGRGPADAVAGEDPRGTPRLGVQRIVRQREQEDRALADLLADRCPPRSAATKFLVQPNLHRCSLQVANQRSDRAFIVARVANEHLHAQRSPLPKDPATSGS